MPTSSSARIALFTAIGDGDVEALVLQTDLNGLANHWVVIDHENTRQVTCPRIARAGMNRVMQRLGRARGSVCTWACLAAIPVARVRVKKRTAPECAALIDHKTQLRTGVPQTIIAEIGSRRRIVGSVGLHAVGDVIAADRSRGRRNGCHRNTGHRSSPARNNPARRNSRSWTRSRRRPRTGNRAGDKAAAGDSRRRRDNRRRR